MLEGGLNVPFAFVLCHKITVLPQNTCFVKECALQSLRRVCFE